MIHVNEPHYFAGLGFFFKRFASARKAGQRTSSLPCERLARVWQRDQEALSLVTCY